MAAAVLLLLLGFIWGWRTGLASGARFMARGGYDRARLSWVAEGIMERISELRDELVQVRSLMDE